MIQKNKRSVLILLPSPRPPAFSLIDIVLIAGFLLWKISTLLAWECDYVRWWEPCQRELPVCTWGTDQTFTINENTEIMRFTVVQIHLTMPCEVPWANLSRSCIGGQCSSMAHIYFCLCACFVLHCKDSMGLTLKTTYIRTLRNCPLLRSLGAISMTHYHSVSMPTTIKPSPVSWASLFII